MDTEQLIKIGSSYAGCGATGHRADEYLEICWPTDRPEHRARMARGQSSCALFATGLWHKLGLVHPLIEAPYWGDPKSPVAQRNDAVSRIEKIAREFGAWRGPETPPGWGAVAIIGSDTDKNYGGPGHVLVTTFCSAGGYCESVDGGQVYNPQRDNEQWGGYGITMRVRAWERVGGIWWLHTADHPYEPGRHGPGRRLYGWVDCEKLPVG